MGRDWVACETFRHLTAGGACETDLPVDDGCKFCLRGLECSTSNGKPDIVYHQQVKGRGEAADLCVLWGLDCDSEY